MEVVSILDQHWRLRYMNCIGGEGDCLSIGIDNWAVHWQRHSFVNWVIWRSVWGSWDFVECCGRPSYLELHKCCLLNERTWLEKNTIFMQKFHVRWRYEFILLQANPLYSVWHMWICELVDSAVANVWTFIWLMGSVSFVSICQFSNQNMLE